jgi:hypothetical protein
MKTTIDIADALLERAKAEAQRPGTTLRDLVERGLTLVVNNEFGTKPFALRTASVGGSGASPEWQALSDEDRVASM